MKVFNMKPQIMACGPNQQKASLVIQSDSQSLESTLGALL